FGHVGERKADFEMSLGDLQVPELVLDDDGHLLRILGLEVLGDADTRGAGQEGDEEMMIAWEPAGRCDLCQNLANDPAQRVLCQNVVADVVLPHAFLSFVGLVLSQRYMPCASAAGNP